METAKFFHHDMNFLLVHRLPPSEVIEDISKSSDASGLVAAKFHPRIKKPYSIGNP